MKLLIASDIHGSYYYAEKLIQIFNELGADRLVLLGDILYHGPRNDLPRDYNPKAVFELLNRYAHKTVCVMGNCDSEVDQMVLDFDVSTKHKQICADGLTLHLLHGHRLDNLKDLGIKAGEIVLCGHTHVNQDQIIDGVRFINPGSISIPKQNSGHGYIVFDNKCFTRYTIE